MSDKSAILHYQQQKGTKPVIEDVILLVIADVAKQKTALDFVAWLRENKMHPRWRGLSDSWAWKADFKGKTIIAITMSTNGWVDHDDTCWFAIPYFDLKNHTEAIMKKNMQGIVQDNQSYCLHKNRDGRTNVGCNPKKACAGGMTKNVFGRNIEGLCCGGGRESLNTRFYDPGETEIDCLKRLLELEQQARAS